MTDGCAFKGSGGDVLRLRVMAGCGDDWIPWSLFGVAVPGRLSAWIIAPGPFAKEFRDNSLGMRHEVYR